MRRRLTILLVDALVLSGIAVVGMWLFKLDTAPLNAAEPELKPDRVDARSAPLPDLPNGTVAVSARVVVGRSEGLIMPGDTVDITRRLSSEPLFADAHVVRIDPPLMAEDDRLHVTFALSLEAAARLRKLRAEELLFIRLAGIHASVARQSFEPIRPAEVITLRYETTDWVKRLSTE